VTHDVPCFVLQKRLKIEQFEVSIRNTTLLAIVLLCKQRALGSALFQITNNLLKLTCVVVEIKDRNSAKFTLNFRNSNLGSSNDIKINRDVSKKIAISAIILTVVSLSSKRYCYCTNTT
jgi:hypothetical protein